jgi:UPF0271 protein
MKIDLNADLGEGLDDSLLLPFLSSANVACGLHAGSPAVMDRTVALALERGVRIGAHPGYPDRENFGRTDLQLPPGELRSLVLYQLGALDVLVRARGGKLKHVKAHGALYNLILVGLAGSAQLDEARAAGLPTAGEAFADRRYLKDGSLMPRSQSGAVLHDPAEAAAQALSIVRDGSVTTSDGSRIAVSAKTLCLHGDTPGAAEIARAVHQALRGAGAEIAPL